MQLVELLDLDFETFIRGSTVLDKKANSLVSKRYERRMGNSIDDFKNSLDGLMMWERIKGWRAFEQFDLLEKYLGMDFVKKIKSVDTKTAVRVITSMENIKYQKALAMLKPKEQLTEMEQ